MLLVMARRRLPLVARTARRLAALVWLRGDRHPGAVHGRTARLGDRRDRPPAVDRLRADAHLRRRLAHRQRAGGAGLTDRLWRWSTWSSARCGCSCPARADHRARGLRRPVDARAATGRPTAGAARPRRRRCSRDPDLPTIWFVLIGVLLVGYAVLDGFDLGVGMLSLFVGRSDDERGTLMRRHRPGLGWQRGLAAHDGWRPLRGLPARLCDGLLRLLPGADAAPAGAHHARGGDGVPPSPGRRRLAAAGTGVLRGLAAAGAAARGGAGQRARGLPLDATAQYPAACSACSTRSACSWGSGVAMFAMQGAAWLVLRTEGGLRHRARRVARWHGSLRGSVAGDHCLRLLDARSSSPTTAIR